MRYRDRNKILENDSITLDAQKLICLKSVKEFLI